ncbi:hypothetical protein EAG_10217 [Camponotus floridanus]|uniref:Uncharacterized protein n=1 Tax=Camponotus floridanus TaxID=104421 RepID=E1ZZK2_CAMFO|nr:hypothetical protein EAG_10217 [Camponotus floridanus]
MPATGVGALTFRSGAYAVAVGLSVLPTAAIGPAVVKDGPERSSQTLRSYRKFNSEQRISYKHGSKNASLRSYRSKTSDEERAKVSVKEVGPRVGHFYRGFLMQKCWDLRNSLSNRDFPLIQVPLNQITACIFRPMRDELDSGQNSLLPEDNRSFAQSKRSSPRSAWQPHQYGVSKRSNQTLRSYRKFNSEQKVSYKHGSKNASLRSYRSKMIKEEQKSPLMDRFQILIIDTYYSAIFYIALEHILSDRVRLKSKENFKINKKNFFSYMTVVQIKKLLFKKS